MKECDSKVNLNVGFDRINNGYVNTLSVLNANVYGNAEHQDNDHIITKDVSTSTDNSVVTKEEAGIKIITKTNGAKEPIATKIVAGCCEKFDHNKEIDLNAKQQGKESTGTHPNQKDENGDMLEVPNYNLQTRKEGKKCSIF